MVLSTAWREVCEGGEGWPGCLRWDSNFIFSLGIMNLGTITLNNSNCRLPSSGGIRASLAVATSPRELRSSLVRTYDKVISGRAKNIPCGKIDMSLDSAHHACSYAMVERVVNTTFAARYAFGIGRWNQWIPATIIDNYFLNSVGVSSTNRSWAKRKNHRAKGY
jgi:hypothetical protein